MELHSQATTVASDSLTTVGANQTENSKNLVYKC